MPRRHRAARDRSDLPEAPGRPLNLAPDWAQREGIIARAASVGGGGKTYRCPGCQQVIRGGEPHLVIIEEGDVGGRRHWHTPCWRTELRRR
jgi:hypothetical protein